MICCHQILMIGTELVPGTLIFNQLTWLIAREDFINASRRESFGSYMLAIVTTGGTNETCKFNAAHNRSS
jgi:hypothetical protein